jgi:N utilization substance protein B
MGSRRHARECALQMLFQRDLSGNSHAEIRETFWDERPEPEDVRQFADRLVEGTVSQIDQIDRLITERAEHWRLERMPVVDRNILRVAVYELLSSETPAAVIINEAIEIARKFSTDESTVFVNGVLDRIRKELSSASGAAL